MTDISPNNCYDYIQEFKTKINSCNGDSIEIEEAIVGMNNSMNKRLKEFRSSIAEMVNSYSEENLNFEIITSFLTNNSECELDIDLSRFSNVLNRTGENLLELKKVLNAIFVEKLDDIDTEISTNKLKSPKVKPQTLKERQTEYSFIFVTCRSGQNYICISCNEPIAVTSEYLKHMEEYPPGSKNLHLYFYHATKQCFLARGFQDEYLRGITVECEEDISNSIISTLQEVGFTSENIRLKNDPDCDSDGSDTVSQHSEVSTEQVAVVRFFYKRRDGIQDTYVVCKACREPILADTYLTTDTSSYAMHISKECVRDAKIVDGDFSAVKCFVFKLLRSHEELRQLLGCGFYYNKIVGFRPQNPSIKGFSSDHGSLSNQTSGAQFVYRRKDPLKKPPPVCIECHKPIYGAVYLTRGVSKAEPFHLKKTCVRCDDFSTATVTVYKLLRTHHDLKKLLSCGFNYNKIIGFRPSDVDNKESDHERENAETASHISDVCHEPRQTFQFILKRSPLSKQKQLLCSACKGDIVTHTYLSYNNSLEQIFHIKKWCVLSVTKNMGSATCKVFDILRCHKDVTYLLACGFNYNNIIGAIPPKTNEMETMIPPPPRPPPHPSALEASGSTKDIGFIFNEEPFICEQLNQSEKCQGCLQIMRRGATVLRHKERIPREKLKEFPLLSQHYHLSKTCLQNRGFNDRYLSGSCCYVMLTDLDDRSNMLDLLIQCGLSRENLRYGSAVQSVTSSPEPSADAQQSVRQLHFFIIVCNDEAAECNGCGFLLPLNEACLIYGEAIVPNNCSAKYFHINSNCLQAHFTDQQLSTMTCVNNNTRANVSDAVIRGCGIPTIMPRVFGRGRGTRARARGLR